MNEEVDRDWTDRLSPNHRTLLGAGLGSMAVGTIPQAAEAAGSDGAPLHKGQLQPTTTSGNSERGYANFKEPAACMV